MRVLPSLAALLTAFTPGLIQAAHFGTTESLLTFFFITIIYLSIKLINSKSQPPNYKQAPSTKLQTPSKDVLNLRFRICNLFGIWDLKFGIYIMALAIVSGLALGTKLSAIFFLPAPILAILLCRNTKHETRNTKQLTRNLLQVIGYMLLFFVFCFLFFVASSPYNFLAWSDFLGTSTYEAQVAQGKAPVFYTQQFEKTIPVWYQLTRIFPYALGPGLELLGILGLLFIIGRIVHKITRSRTTTYIANEAILLGSFVGYFLPNAFLYCKWTRFITPVMPFFAIFAAWLLSLFFQKLKKLRISNLVLHVTCYMLHALLILPGLLFFTIYLKPDIRAEASEWIYKNIPEDSYVLSETANVVDIPLGLQVTSYKLHDYKVISFNFYDLDSDESLQEKLVNHLLEADYLFVPSHRIFAHVLRLLEKYPLTARYYQLLFSGQLGFEKIAHFSRLPDEAAEETWSVFDHPAIRIYQKKKHFSKDELQRLLTI